MQVLCFKPYGNNNQFSRTINTSDTFSMNPQPLSAHSVRLRFDYLLVRLFVYLSVGFIFLIYLSAGPFLWLLVYWARLIVYLSVGSFVY